ncbi:helix-turn-helix transcriptional regulator [Paenibacillus durus]|uniref:WYL domain-containing protein n=1 Tax=Paenibacillus durus ATCC 35681 TaxID=1333534 RepID=A0A0F7CHM5_PAEDU|nr:WYL domain-containing protein [Paenibacillus durus]AKG33855.1 hypothetical protein VK70_04020 [Paenibacillus durus ATCC 35681]
MVTKKTELNAKYRLWEIKEILEQHSNPNTMLALSEIDELLRLRYPNHNVKRDTIQRDIKFLKEIGFHIRGEKNGAWRYQLLRRDLTLEQLRILIDAVTSSRSLSVRKTREIVDFLKMMASEEEASHLANEIFINHAVKTENEEVQNWIFVLHHAIDQRKIVSFTYAKYGTDKKLSFHNNNNPYIVEPYELVWNSDYYYLNWKKSGRGQLEALPYRSYPPSGC